MDYYSESGRCPEYNALVDSTDDLCRALPINDLFSKLISERVIDFDDKEELCQERTSKRVVEKFIDKHLYPELRVGETKRFKKLINVMKNTDKCDFLVKRIEERVKHYSSGTVIPPSLYAYLLYILYFCSYPYLFIHPSM